MTLLLYIIEKILKIRPFIQKNKKFKKLYTSIRCVPIKCNFDILKVKIDCISLFFAIGKTRNNRHDFTSIFDVNFRIYTKLLKFKIFLAKF